MTSSCQMRLALRVLAEASVSISAFSRSLVTSLVSVSLVLVSVTDAGALEVGKQWTRRFAAAVTIDAVSGINQHFNKVQDYIKCSLYRLWDGCAREHRALTGGWRMVASEGWILVLIVRGTRETRIVGVLDVRGIEEECKLRLIWEGSPPASLHPVSGKRP
ncbi:hypothetical protein EDB86DRAFT_1238702 [Lactarius hatsudake]|nr:hypothetical protein EDB86DRAFT_1238702 [Lactarius hatsudake]